MRHDDYARLDEARAYLVFAIDSGHGIELRQNRIYFGIDKYVDKTYMMST